MSSKVSVIVPCYNQELYLRECLESVVAQTYSNWECIIVNDGSSDNSEVIAKEFCQKDARFSYFYIENSGVSAARNYAVQHSTGVYILPLDGDDRIGESYLELAMKHYEAFPQTKLVYCNAHFFGALDLFWNLPAFEYKQFLRRNVIFCSAVYKRSDFDAIGGYDTSMRIGYEDWDFWISLLDEKSEVFRLDSVEFYYRQRENSRNDFVNNEERHNKVLNYIFSKHQEKYRAVFGYDNIIDQLFEMEELKLNLHKLKSTVSYKTSYKIEKKLVKFINRFKF